MEPSRVELLSRMGISHPIIHRLSPDNPWDGDRQLSPTVGCSDLVFTCLANQRTLVSASVGG